MARPSKPLPPGALRAPFALLALALASALACGAPPGPSPEETAAWEAELQSWRQEREAGLRDPEGWLTLTGLSWLGEGIHRVGSDPTADVVLPAQGVPLEVGVIEVDGGRAVFTSEPRVEVLHDGAPVSSLALASDLNGGPTVLQLGSVSFFLVERAGRLGVRVRDADHPALTGFDGLEVYPPDPAWRLEARFEPYEPPRPLPIVNVLGMVEEVASPGALVFEAAGETRRLDVLPGDEETFFLIFADETNGHGTYGGGRYLYPRRPGEEGLVELDFNRAQNPPCAFTEFATCPLPPPQNRLPLAVEAGERYRGAH